MKEKNISATNKWFRQLDPYKDNANNIIDGLFSRNFKNISFLEIQKLKDLLIEYHGEGVYGIMEPEHGIYLKEAMKARAPYIISRKYGFIRWLIKNRKIDRDKFDERRDEYNKDLRIVGVDDYELLLMLLTIQTEPIDFLSSILK